MANDILKIIAVKCDKGYYISDMVVPDHYKGSELTYVLFDGKRAEQSFCKNWFLIPDLPKTVGYLKSQPNINHRYELREEHQSSGNLPAVITADMFSRDGNGDPHGEFYNLANSPLYNYKYDTPEPVFEEKQFEINIVLEVDNIEEPERFSYEVYRSRWTHEGTTHITNSSAITQLLDRIVFPKIILHDRPCKLTSKQSFDIIRFHVKQNINLEVSKITSDYDFCFTVKKRVKLHNPYEWKRELKKSNGRSYAKPRYQTKFVTDKEITVFEMTSSDDRYKGYSVIPGFEGKNETDLKKNIDEFLTDLMMMINKPIEECPECEGVGIILDDYLREKLRK